MKKELSKKLKGKKINIKPIIEDVSMEPGIIKRPPDAELPPDPNKPVEK